ncbi:uncharacterized protein ACN427_008645 [Glossina fuscipes fuscipes]
MFKNKKDLDAHIAGSFSKLRSETERNLRGFTVAKLYYRINEFSTAKQYLNSYLSVKKDNAEAHKLMGQIYIMLKNSDKALQSFQCSLQLNTKQPDVLTEICRLLLEDTNISSNKAKYWCELAESAKIQDDAVFELRMKLMEGNETETLLKKKIIDRPNSVQLRVHLVRYYIEKNQVVDAFNYVYQLEMSQKDEFSDSSEWYNVVWLVLSQYEKQPNVKKDWDYWLLLIICLERQVQISFAFNCSPTTASDTSETTNFLFKLDQYLFKFSQISDFLCAEKDLIELFFDHYRGQLLLHVVALIFKHDLLKNRNKWKDTVRLALPLLLLAFQVQPHRGKEAWMKYCDEHGRQLTTLCQREGSFRCAQAGRILLSCICNQSTADKEKTSRNIASLLNNQEVVLWTNTDDLLACVRKICADSQWRRNVFATLFYNSDQKTEQQSSLLIKSPKFCEPIYEIPSSTSVERYEEEAQYFRPQSLHHAVYLCLGRDNLALVRARYFNGLNFSTQNLNFCGAESLNQLDVDSFMYATTIQAKRVVDVEREICDNYNSEKNNSVGKPRILPFVNMQSQLCTDEQAQWWNAAYRVYKNLRFGCDLTDLKVTLQYGIEAVRGVNGPKVDLNIMFKLGQIFAVRAQATERPVDKSLLEARSESIYRTALNMLKMRRGGVLEPFDKHFKYARAQSTDIERELNNAAEDAVTYVANRYFKRLEYEELIEEFAGLQLPFASYWQAEAYLKLDEIKKTSKKTKRLNVERAAECLNHTLALLKSGAYVDPKHALNTIIHHRIRKIKQMSASLLDDSLMEIYCSPHNNSSSYEDAENDVYQDSFAMPAYSQGNLNRLRREITGTASFTATAHNQEMESMVKQMASTLILLKEEILENLKPDLRTVAKEVVSMKDRIGNLEETMRKSRISSIPPSRDDASNVLDDFYIIEDTLQQQLYQQPQTSITAAPAFMSSNQYSTNTNGLMTNNPFLGQQPRLQTPTPMHLPPNAFNNTMFPPNAANYPLNFYSHNQPNAYLPQGAQQGLIQANQRNLQLSLPYTQPPISGGLNFNTTPVLNSQLVEKGPPANVVITSSDPLPNTSSITLQSPQQPTLSVTIPPQHLKANVLANHPASLGTAAKNSAAVASTEASNKYATFSFKPEVEAAAAAAAAAAASTSLKDKTTESFGSDINKSAVDLGVEYDARPDFKGIIPLPEEIVICTGEEDEEITFCHRAKLFRYVDKEWKERGIGDIKILKNKDGAHRILMRRDQIHKICANHKISPEMSLTIPKNETKGFIWAANDFSDAELRVEKFFVRFKLPETAAAFQEAFNQARREAVKSGKTSTIETTPFSLAKSTIRNFASSTPTNKNENTTDGSSPLSGIPNVVHSTAADSPKITTAPFSSLTNFTFGKSLAGNTGVSIGCDSCTTSTMTLINCTSSVTGTISSLTSASSVTNANTSANTISSSKNVTAASPFASIFNNLNKSTAAPFSIATAVTTSVTPVMVSKENATSNLNKSAASDAEDDYVSNAEFQPVIPLPDVVEVNTGEENEIVLFEHRAKLLRFDKKAGEWKERGLGNIKLLQDKDDVNKLRLLMRREQVHKLCCNQRVYKDTAFTYMKNSDTALSWAGQDFSDNELVVEMLTVRFKTPEVCKQFLKALNEAQDRMSAEGREANVQSSKASSEAAAKNTEMGSKGVEKKQGFGDIFKPKAGSWTCQACYILNKADKMYCVACDSPKDNTVSPKPALSNIAAPISNTFNFGFPAAGAASTILTPSLPTQSTFTFQKPDANMKNAIAFSDKQPTTDVSRTSLTSIGGFGDQFKPKAGSWVCPGCYVSNTGDSIHCMACEAPKNSTIPKKEANANVLCLSDPAQKFSFGFPVANTSKSETITPKVDFRFNTGSIPAAGVLAFTSSLPTSTSLSTIPITTVAPNPSTLIPESSDKLGFLNGEESVSDAFSLNRKVFNFTLKPKSPGKSGKSPSKFGSDADGAGDEDTESEFPDEEESSAHFTPIITLPEKVKVKTGEEEEETLYVHRAKLYRFIDGEWKERGIGNVKILRHKETKKLRVIMRRDQVLKICLNHNLNEDVDYKRKDHKSWLFVVNDFSEEAIELQKLSLRFKNKEIADKFMEAVIKALDGTATPIIETVGSNNSINTSASSGLPSSALNITEESEKLASDLKLPLNFFESAKPDCIGCRGCDPEKFTFTDDGNNKIFINEEDIKSLLLPMELPPLVLLKQSTLSPIISTTATTLITTTAGASINFKKKLVNTFNASANNVKESADETTPASTTDLSQENPKTCSIIKPGNIFGGFTEMTNAGEESIFSGVANSTSTDADKTQSISIFGGTGNSLPGGSIFGQKPPIFGNSPSIFGDTTKSIFGSSNNNSKGGSINTSIFGSSYTSFTGFAPNKPTTAGGYVFGSTEIPTTTAAQITTSLFEGLATNTDSAGTESFMDLSKTATAAIDFASLAAQAPKDDKAAPALAKGNEKPAPCNFIGLTGQNAFASFAKPLNEQKSNDKDITKDDGLNDAKNNQSGDCGTAENNSTDENYDPHYEPIIALPEEIVITTGEEEETKLFGERATLFRWDDTNKEWKERGVGELKILFHPVKQTYRMLMRREQIYKLILNHVVNADFSFSEMNKNPKSFLWGAMNYAECPEGVLEKLAVRFKNVKLAEQFREQLNKCIAANQNRDNKKQRMFKNKKDLDAHIAGSFSKLRSETERNLRGFTVAKLYYRINEFSTAKQYLNSYLSVKKDNAEAHKLMGQIYIMLKNSDKALQSFQCSLQLNTKQPDVLTEICRLLLEDTNISSNKAKYWCELAESAKIQDDAVFELRMKLMEGNETETLLKKKIIDRPNSVQLRVHLVRYYIEKNQVVDAFNYVYQLEMSQKDEFSDSSEWYNVVWLVLSQYEKQPNVKKDWDYWLLLIICLERQVQISFAFNCSPTTASDTSETTNFLFKLDQYLFKFSQISDFLCAEKDLIELFFDHYRGQLLLHVVALIFKHDLLKNRNKWKDTVRLALPLLLLAFQVQPHRGKEAWMTYCDEHGRQLTTLCQREGSFRCAQAGRILLSCICNQSTADKEKTSRNIASLLNNQEVVLWTNTDDLLACVRKICADSQWRRNVFATLFYNSDQKTEQQSSLLIKSPKFCEPIYEIPSSTSVERYEEEAQYFRPQSLHHAVYLCLGRDNLALVRARYFNGLNFSTQNLNFCGAESLNQLDVDSFMYATTIQAKRVVDVEREICDNYNSEKNNSVGKPRILPFVNMQSQLCTDEQAQWWNAAYRVYKNLRFGCDLTDLKVTLQYGIEAVRGVNGPKVDLNIMFKLGQIFVVRAQATERPVDKSLLEARSESIYRTALNMLKMRRGGVLEPFDKHFKYARAQSTDIERELNNAAEDAVTYVANRYFKRLEYEELIEEFTSLQLPFASYWQAEAYLKLDEVKKTSKKTKRLNVERAAECLNHTLALLKSSSYVDPKHALNTIIHHRIRKIKQMSASLLDDSLMEIYCSPHNNSSSYEDAENDVYQDSFAMPAYSQGNLNRLRREITGTASFTATAHNQEMENMVKQMASTLILLKEEILENLKPDLRTVAKEVVSMKDRIGNLEETMRKSRISSIPPSRDDASKVLDDFYIIEDALRQQLYQQPQTAVTTAPAFMSSNQCSAATDGLMTNNPFLGQQPRLQTPTPMHLPPNAFNNTMFPPNAANYPLNFYSHNQPNAYLTQGAQQGSLQANQRNLQLSLPYTQPPISGGLNFNTTPVLNSQLVEKGPPANVVITSSDPLPNTSSITLQSPQQPTLSVTIPPQHLKANVLANHPASLGTAAKNSAAVASTEASNKYATFSFKPEVEAAAAAAAAAAASTSLKDKTTESFGSDINKSAVDLGVEYDARPDFKGIIPLPEEIVICTGEEDEEITFCHRAKLFRYVDKEWKERGIGDIKILKNKDGAHRILMRRDQIHKICANHKISPEMSLTIPKNETKGFIWAANDFSDAELRVEKFFVRFKLPETAAAFQEAFNQARREAVKSGKTSTIETTPFSLAKSTIRNFASSTPTNKNENTTDGSSPLSGIPNVVHSTAADSPKITTAPFSSLTNFTFGKSLAGNTGVSIGCGSCTTSTMTLINCTSSVTGTISSLTSASSVTNANTSANTISSSKNVTAASPFASIFNNLNKSTAAPFSIATAVTTSVTPVMVSKENATSNLNKSAASDAEDDYVSNAEFQPVIPLPDVVEVNTGEENEIVLFEHRAKLLRFDKKAGEWKERGLGNIKLLQDKDDVNKLRLLMRREQVHKLCCNQRVYKDTAFTYMKNSDTALSWAGQDFSDNELVVEMLTVRFKTPEVCKQFLKALNEAQDRMSAEGREANVQSSKASSEAAAKNTEMGSKGVEKKQGFGDIFKPKAGSWTCQACYILNKADKMYCVACDSPKDNTVSPKPALSNIAAPISNTFNFGFPAAGAASTILTPSLPTQSTFTFQKPDANMKNAIAFSDKQPTTDVSRTSLTSIGGFGDQFKPKAGSWVCPSCYVSNTGDSIHCMACEAPKNSTIPKKEANANVLCLSDPAQKFSFGFPVANTSKSEIITPKVDFRFNTGSIPAAGVLAFTSSLPTSTSLSTIPITTVAPNPSTFIPESSDKLGFLNGEESVSDAFSLNRKVFNFTLKPKSPGKSGKSPSKFGSDADGAGDEDTESEFPDEEESSAHFTPIITLPEKVKVKTGEEEEETLYVHRAKLYRFIDGEWKERGIGNVKILRHKETKKLRVIMRRDQVLKICLNHNLNEDVDYKRKDHKSWLFVVNDFSEEAIELQKLSLRFKNKEIADKFMEAVIKALDGTASPIIETVGSNTSINTSASSGLPSSALNITEESEKLASDLKLPLNFFESAKPDCIGCRGCDPEKFTFTDDGNNKIFINEEDIKSLLLPMELPPLVLLKQSTLSPIISTTATTLITTTAGASINFKKKLVNTFNASANNVKESADETTPASTTDLSQENPKTCSIIKPGNIFGGFTEMTNAGEESIFSGVANSTSTDADKTQSISIFGGTGNSLPGGSIFGQKPPIFGNSPSIFGDTTKSIFGSSNNNSKGGSINTSIFGSSYTSFTGFAPNKPITAGRCVFGSTEIPTTTAAHVATSLFEGVGTNTGSAGTESFMDLSKTATAAIDFASLAAQAPKDDKAAPALAKGNEKPAPCNFIGLTGQNAFASFAKPLNEQKSNDKDITKDDGLNDAKNNQSGDCGNAENNSTDENYDPHYEPIIALPEEIVITTGEEEETKLFGERATLFRWDDTNKEWKERGVGELKILFHPVKQTYRMLMRREQIYKLILNHVVNADFSFNEMNKNPKSFLWGAMNYAECPEGVLEKLAVRFKNVKLAEQFREQLNKCIAADQNRDN